MEPPIMHGYYKQKILACITVWMVGITLFCVCLTDAVAKDRLANGQIKTIVFDPGHGGHETGVKGPIGIYEKDITLTFARMLADRLEKQYRIHLTRTDDYYVDLYGRTAVANHLKADLFISIHTGGSTIHTLNGVSIFYFQEISETVMILEAWPLKSPEGGDTRVIWDHIQDKHKRASSNLAEQIGHHLADPLGLTEIKIQSAPLKVLEGADMPAVLIEIGYLTHPADGKKLKDKSVLSDLVKAVTNGIEDYFKKFPG
ncbi:MAG: N-acetylmuramoyl-L-alanine amidase [Deltaproteobacteria bacterium]|nr:N-acetylmuramoyl-L-alanine amidase [Deltaproteobacteria bacterium]